ncbi:MAG: hypothetical protein C6I00_00870 [Nitratiruptor sp.]|nr:hypothetical protein [Nitratiruptor sp.]NPA83422.1 hypothetical protein [Campylobacterota bacterium]
MEQAERNFQELSLQEKREAIEQTIDEGIRQFLVMDGGNLEVVEVQENGDYVDVYIRYMGACVGCASATTGTLLGIEHTLRERLNYPNIRVLPI